MPHNIAPHRGAVAAAVLATALLAGCAGTGGLRSTAVANDPASLHAERSLAGVKLDAAAWPRSDWWKTIGDPQLDKLVDEALAGNPDMALADARVRAALAAAGAADAARKPTLNGGAAVAGARVPPLLPPLASGHFGVIKYGYLSFKWDLDLWGGKRAAWQAAVGNARAAEIDAQAARMKLSADVVQAYFDLAGAYAQRDLAQAELQRAEDFLALTRKRVASGIDSKFSLARIEGETASDRAHLEAADNAVHTSGLVLAALLGRGPDRALSIARPASPALPALALPSDLPADLLGRRPDVVAARWRVEAASQDIKAAKAKFLPNLGISSLAGLIAPSSLDLFSLTNRFYTISPALSLPIFEGGALRANLAGKDAARDIAVAQYNQTLVHAVNQVAAQVDDLRSLDAQVRDAESARASADNAYKLAMQRYRAGVGNFLEALSVRQELIAAEQQLAALQTRRSNAWAMLNEALGGGFEPARDAPSLAAAHDTPSEPKAIR
ncbi:MAG: Outer membrane factor (OMF) lipoprotein associated wth EmrAB-OMF efflux system [Rhodanobacteraceae bacterium]|jgi:NodT family efflux transporter outer membrane factor (OMF) lipoprotein|nr:MAG: Outer membrane factor (OMF) lipoprotein associated wth EmrAB-OMF efflux system [Rhodanobacteraceae bacterium]